MQIVINITEKLYDEIKRQSVPLPHVDVLCESVLNGTPLPKGHGRLIDADALNIRMEQRMDEIGDDESIWESSNVATALDMFAPTIIEADGGDTE